MPESGQDDRQTPVPGQGGNGPTPWYNFSMLALPVRLIVALVGLALFVACGSPEVLPATAELTPIETPTTSPSPTPSPTPIPSPTPSPTATPEPTPVAAQVPPGAPSAIEILEASFAAMEAVESMHLEMLAEITISSGGTETNLPIKLVGDFQAPDRVHSSLSVSLGFFSIEIETIAIGDDVYTTDPLTGAWSMSSEAAFAFPAPSDFGAGAELALLDPILLGIGELDGGTVFRLTGAPPPDIFGTGGVLTDAEFWIGVDDFLIRKITAEAEVGLDEISGALGDVGISGPATISLTITISDFGKPVVIEAPELP